MSRRRMLRARAAGSVSQKPARKRGKRVAKAVATDADGVLKPGYERFRTRYYETS